MIKYLELCVDLKKAYMAKEGLFQYRNMCQSVGIVTFFIWNGIIQVIFIAG